MEREDRYLILKRADIADHLDDKYKDRLDGICAHIQQCRKYYGKSDTKYVVVADDWPMYDQVWGLIENWVDGGASSSMGCYTPETGMRDREFCKRLVEIRAAKGLTQAQLESKAGLPATLISHYEKGERAPGLENIKALCRGLGCTATELLGV
tara:strand:+ start:7262 stop:7720 length:459 start_codon:yes stop_codon:yes gene_type:complete